MGILHNLFLRVIGEQENPSKEADVRSEEIAEYNRKIKAQIDKFCRSYDLTTAEGIRSIPISEMKKWIQHASGAPSHPEQILNKKATEYKRNGKMELAIECLRKANEIYPISDYVYREKNYLRLVYYLRDAGRFEEAKKEQNAISRMFGHLSDEPPTVNPIGEKANKIAISWAHDLGTDLVEASWANVCCEKCGKYRGRIFSLSGKNKNYPRYPKDFCTACGLTCYPFYEGVSSPQYYTMQEIRELTYRPFTDTRTAEEKAAYEAEQHTITAENKDRADYAWIQEHLTADSPKSFGGYRRMKNSNSANFQKLKELAQKAGRTIG